MNLFGHTLPESRMMTQKDKDFFVAAVGKNENLSLSEEDGFINVTLVGMTDEDLNGIQVCTLGQINDLWWNAIVDSRFV
jgi:hypothetical protein